MVEVLRVASRPCPGRAPASNRGLRPALLPTACDARTTRLCYLAVLPSAAVLSSYAGAADGTAQPWRCLCRGSEQITMTRPWRRMILHLLQIFLTLGLTFTANFSSWPAGRALLAPGTEVPGCPYLYR